MKTVQTLTLYHGSTVGWLHISGFQQAKFPYGEFTNPHPFIFLCTNQSGGKSAAYKSFAQVSNRNPNGFPNAPYYYNGTFYPPDRYLYEISIPCNTEYLDFNADKLSPDDRRRVLMAMNIQIKGKLSKSIDRICTQIDYIGCPKYWTERLQRIFENDRNSLVNALADEKFCLIKNFERDGDGQNYGEVWCLTMAHAGELQLKNLALFNKNKCLIYNTRSDKIINYRIFSLSQKILPLGGESAFSFSKSAPTLLGAEEF